MTLSDNGSVAWVLAQSIAAFLMVPGVGLFYSGLTHKKSLLSTIGFSYLIFSISTLTWGLVGFSLAYGNETLAKGFIGDCTYCGLRGISFAVTNPFSNSISYPAFFFQEMIKAGISSVILTIPFMGKLRPIFLFLMTMSHQLIIYSPIAYWLRSQSGWLNQMGAIDFSGAAMVFLSSGFSVLGMMYMIGEKKQEPLRKNSTGTLSTVVGTGLIWFASFGFNSSSTTSIDLVSSNALINTQLSAAGGVLGWTFAQYLFTDRSKISGWCSGALCGLVSIAPCSGYVSLWSSAVIGSISGIGIYIFCHFNTQQKKEEPDTLGAFSGHGLSAFWGLICCGAFATLEVGPKQGLFYGGAEGARLFGVNILFAVVASAYSFALMVSIHFLSMRLVEPNLTESQIELGLDAYSNVQQADLFDEEDIFNMIRTLNNLDQKKKISVLLKQNESFLEKQPQINGLANFRKVYKQIRKQNSELLLPSTQQLVQRVAVIDRQKEEDMMRLVKGRLLAKNSK